MSTLKLDTLSNKAGTASVPSETIVSGTAKAWVNFNGTGTVAIRRAFNVSSVTDNGTGDYTVNFTSAMSDANYSVMGTLLNDQAYVGGTSLGGTHLYTISTTNARVRGNYYTGSTNNLVAQDKATMLVTIFS